MRFDPLPISGAFLIAPSPIEDERGLFARVWCEEEFARQGLMERPVQANTGFSPRRGTLRGLHYQAAPDLEAKLVRCTQGAVYDVMVDLRPGSPTFGRWHGTELSADNRLSLHVPSLCAHGYLTLTDNAELLYFASAPYVAASARGLRHDDPALGISWPIPVAVVSSRDRSWPLLETTERAS
jgi:dTDP-4-dehydrorhamnose 3,5-epimerase